MSSHVADHLFSGMVSKGLGEAIGWLKSQLPHGHEPIMARLGLPGDTICRSQEHGEFIVVMSLALLESLGGGKGVMACLAT